jgi:hypothetical protein
MSIARLASGNAAVDGGYDMFAPEGIPPEEFWGLEQRGVQGGERRLMAALLSDGIESYITWGLKKARGEALPYSEVAEWVESQDRGYIFSFDMVCESLGINPNYLRLGLKRYFEESEQPQGEGERTTAKVLQWTKIRRPRSG